jgi:hypothetical protein
MLLFSSKSFIYILSLNYASTSNACFYSSWIVVDTVALCFSSWHGVLHRNLANGESHDHAVGLGRVPPARNNRRSQRLRHSVSESDASDSGLRRCAFSRLPPLQLRRQLLVNVRVVGQVVRDGRAVSGIRRQTERRQSQKPMRIGKGTRVLDADTAAATATKTPHLSAIDANCTGHFAVRVHIYLCSHYQIGEACVSIGLKILEITPVLTDSYRGVCERILESTSVCSATHAA